MNLLKKMYFHLLLALFFDKKRYRYAPSPLGKRLIPLLPEVCVSWNCGYRMRPLLNNYLWLKCSMRGEHEPALEQVLSLALGEGSVVVDAGAQIGLLSVLCAKMVGDSGRVLSFEPHPENYRTLKEAIVQNGLRNVEVVNKGLGAKKAVLYFWEALASGLSLLPETKEDWPCKATQALEVECITLDAFLAEQRIHTLDVLKVDVDGPDFAVLLGAQELLRGEVPPLVIFESSCYWLSLGYRLQTAVSFFRELGYELYVSPISSKRIFSLGPQDTLPPGWGEELRKALNVYAIKNAGLRRRLVPLFDRAEPISRLGY
jgi:FkbM family methyltransferase